jgi:hypothetical protein
LNQLFLVGFEVFTAVVATCLLAGLLNYSSTLKMEAIRSSETPGATQRTTRRHIPEDDTLQLFLNGIAFTLPFGLQSSELNEIFNFSQNNSFFFLLVK